MKTTSPLKNHLTRILVGLATCSLLGPPASATILFTNGNSQYNGVNFAGGASASVVTGEVTIGALSLDVLFLNGIGPDGTTPILLHAQHGAASVENDADAASSTPQIGFSSITMKPQASYGFTAGDFKLDEINSDPAGSVTFLGIDQFGNPTTETFPIFPNGQNPYQFTTANGELVTSLVITVPTTNLLADIKQVSVDMVLLPEPATLALLAAGLTILGILGRASHDLLRR